MSENNIYCQICGETSCSAHPPSGPVAPEPTDWGAVEYRAWKGQIEHVKQVKAEAVAPAGGETPDWRKMCIVEISCENQSVSDYIKHWEGRTLKAEAQLALLESERDGLRIHLKAVLDCFTDNGHSFPENTWKVVVNARAALAGAPSPQPDTGKWIIVATGEGAEARILNGDLHESVHRFMCCCGQPWRECTSAGVTEDVALIDDAGEWSNDESGNPFSIGWEYETGRTVLYRAGAPSVEGERE